MKHLFLVPLKEKSNGDNEEQVASKKLPGKKNKKSDHGDDVPLVPRSQTNSIAVWSWEETPSQMKRHDPSEIESESQASNSV